MSDPMVRIVSVKCQECGKENMPRHRVVMTAGEARTAGDLLRHTAAPECFGRVLIATEPVQGEGD